MLTSMPHLMPTPILADAAGFFMGLFIFLFVFVCLFLILLVLIQKGRGGGLASAFGGGGGGSTAFGAKTGDVLTWVTSITFGIFLLLAVILNWMSNRDQSSVATTADQTTTPTQDVTPAGPEGERPTSGPTSQMPGTPAGAATTPAFTAPSTLPTPLVPTSRAAGTTTPAVEAVPSPATAHAPAASAPASVPAAASAPAASAPASGPVR